MQKTKAQISCAVTTQLISTFDFTTQIVQSLYFLNLSFFLSILSRSILIIISGVVGGYFFNLAKGKNIRNGPLNLKFSILQSSSVAVQSGLCRTWLKSQRHVFSWRSLSYSYLEYKVNLSQSQGLRMATYWMIPRSSFLYLSLS